MIVFGALDRAADSSHREGDLGSFSLHREVSLLGRGRTFVDGMRAIEQRRRDAERELSLEEWRREPGKATFLDGLARSPPR